MKLRFHYLLIGVALTLATGIITLGPFRLMHRVHTAAHQLLARSARLAAEHENAVQSQSLEGSGERLHALHLRISSLRTRALALRRELEEKRHYLRTIVPLLEEQSATLILFNDGEALPRAPLQEDVRDTLQRCLEIEAELSRIDGIIADIGPQLVALQEALARTNASLAAQRDELLHQSILDELHSLAPAVTHSSLPTTPSERRPSVGRRGMLEIPMQAGPSTAVSDEHIDAATNYLNRL